MRERAGEEGEERVLIQEQRLSLGAQKRRLDMTPWSERRSKSRAPVQTRKGPGLQSQAKTCHQKCAPGLVVGPAVEYNLWRERRPEAGRVCGQQLLEVRQG